MGRVDAPPLPRTAAEAAPRAREGADRPSMPLVRRLALLTAGFALVLVLGAAEIALSWSARSRLEDYRDDAVSLATTFAGLLTEVAPTGDPQALARGLEEWSGNRLGIRTRRAWIYVMQSGLLTPVEVAGQAPKRPETMDYDALARGASVVVQRDGPDPAWLVATPLGPLGHPYGVLEIAVSTQRLGDWSRLERQRAYLAAVVAALLVALGVALLTRMWVARPLAALGHAMAGAHGGAEGSPAAPEIGPHEFRVLARRYNQLREALTRREHESEARGALLALQERARGLDRLALVQETSAAFAHEIGTPLNTLSGHLQLLRDDLHSAGQPVMVERVRLLLGQVDRVAGIVRAGLDRARWPHPFVRTADLHAIAERILRFLEPSLSEAGVSAALAPASIPPAIAVCDPAQVEQILLNLLKNSMEALAPSGRIEVTSGVDGAQAYVLISDNGPGMSPATQESLFTPFATTKGADGTGLGLAVSRRLARGLGGDLIYVPSARGTRWRLALPAAEAR
jgi:two-component system NtrC family sensor kinase